ncbi:hypothetical protein EWI07_03815 [Sporolactobacillus sp. THM7-4]|nr:hypothetical protein EWI07_03815 [Sporolactobacillus sp. THM7-4]
MKFGKVCHADQTESRIKNFEQLNAKKHLSLPQIQQLQDTLLREHADPQLDVLKTFGIPAIDLLLGIHCSSCGSFNVKRAYGTWHCKQCGQQSNAAHEQDILDYFLILAQP